MVSETDSSAGTDGDAEMLSDGAWYLLGTSTLVVFHVLVAFLALGAGIGALPTVLGGSASPGATAACLVAVLVGSFSAYRAVVLILE